MSITLGYSVAIWLFFALVSRRHLIALVLVLLMHRLHRYVTSSAADLGLLEERKSMYICLRIVKPSPLNFPSVLAVDA